MRVVRQGSFSEKGGPLDQGYLAASVQELSCKSLFVYLYISKGSAYMCMFVYVWRNMLMLVLQMYACGASVTLTCAYS